MAVMSRKRASSASEAPKAIVVHGRRPVRAPRGHRGFTIIELMVVVSVAVVLTAVAVPSFKVIILGNKLTTTANDVIAAINAARSEAVKLNTNTQLCSDSSANNTTDTLGAACTTAGTGAVVALVGTTTPTVRGVIGGITAPIKLNGNMTALRFGGVGLAYTVGSTAPYTGTVADICTSTLTANNHRIITMTTGSALSTTTTTSATCP